MEDKKGRSAPLFDTGDSWRLMEITMRTDDWAEANKKMSEYSAQNTDALIEIFNLGFRAGIHFAQDTYEKERHH